MHIKVLLLSSILSFLRNISHFIPCKKGTGNVLLDMQQQLQANSIRINVLEQENSTLLRSLEKLGERAQHNASRVSH